MHVQRVFVVCTIISDTLNIPCICNTEQNRPTHLSPSNLVFFRFLSVDNGFAPLSPPVLCGRVQLFPLGTQSRRGGGFLVRYLV